MANPTRKRLTQDEKDKIAELRLLGIPVRDVARTVGCAVNTVTKVYRDFLKARAESNPVEAELLRALHS